MAKQPTPLKKDNLEDLLKPGYLEDLMATVRGQDLNDPNLIDEIVVRVCAFWPEKAYQATVRFRNRTLAWGTFVHRDPLMAQMCALHIALRGPTAVKLESTAMFHKSKEKAGEVASRLLADYPGILVISKVELEPSYGWVAVVFTKPGYDPANLKELAGIAEVREAENANEPPRRRSPTKAKTNGDDQPKEPEAPAKPKALAKPKAPAKAAGTPPEGDRSAMTKSALIKEHQRLFGKQPNNKLSREEIIEIIESKLAAQQGDDDDDGESLM